MASWIVSAVSAVADVLTLCAGNVVARWLDLAPYLALWTLLHLGLQYGVPAVFPRVYEPLTRKAQHKEALSPKMMAWAAKEARTKGICTLMALWVTAAGLYGVYTGVGAAMERDLLGSTPLTDHLVLFATSYFLWDVVVCLLDRESMAFHFHGWACLITFASAMTPYVQYMALVTLLFEASTPLLHLRKYMIQTCAADDNPAFTVVQAAFAATFFLFRIVIGFKECGAWAWRMYLLLAAGGVDPATSAIIPRPLQSVSAVLLTLCVALSCLNAYWFSLMVLGGAGDATKHAKPNKDASGKAKASQGAAPAEGATRAPQPMLELASDSKKSI